MKFFNLILTILLILAFLDSLIASGQLLIIKGLDALGIINADNALGHGILAMFTFCPSIILIIIGSILSFLKKNKTINSY